MADTWSGNQIDHGDGTYSTPVEVKTALPAGTALVGKVGIDQTTPGTTNRVDVGTIAAGTTHIGNVGGDTKTVTATFARPGDTTAYAANDAVADSTSAPTAMSLASVVAANAGTGYITAVMLQKSTVTATNAAFRVWLWNATPTLVNDNAAYTLLWADRAKLIGYVDLVLRSEGSGSDTAVGLDDSRRIPFTCAVADTHLFATLTAEAAYAPGNAENFLLSVTVERN